jgi:ABC-type dipeptide/oligopeptide/nickel transport system permease component
MLRYIVRRVLLLIPVMLGVTLVTFLVMQLAPGDPAALLVDERSAGVDAATAESIRKQWGLDQPPHIQYLRFLSGVVRGDLGRSFSTRQEVTPAIVERLPATAALALAALAFAVSAGMLLGTLAALRQGKWFDFATMVASLSGVCTPAFWLGPLLIFFFSVHLRLLPASGYGHWTNLVLPAVALGTISAATIARITRSSMLEVIGSEFIAAARAKGLTERVIVYKHALRNALIPVLTILGLQLGGLLSGAVITETIFGWPGVGRLLVDSISRRDLPMVQGGVLLLAGIFALANLLADIAYAAADPRIRLT